MGQSTSLPSQQNRPHGDVILAGASVRSLAQSAIRDGLRPICVDMFNDADLQHWLQQCGLPNNLRCIASFADVADQLHDVSSEVRLIPVGGLENEAAVIRQIRQQRLVWLSDERLIQAVRDPEILFPVLQNQGCAVPEFRQNPPPAGAGRWLQKRRRSAGGMGIRWHDSDSQVSDANVYWQEFIDGIPLSATFVNLPQDSHEPSVSADGVGLQWLGCALQLSGSVELHAPEFQFCGNVGPVEVSADLKAQIQHTAQTIVRHWPLRGVFGLDFIVGNKAALLLEVNPRPTASHELHEWSVPQQPGHVVRHAAAWQDSAINTTSRSAPVRLPSQMSGDLYARLVLYAPSDMRLAAETQQLLLSYSLRPQPGTAFAGASERTVPAVLSPQLRAQRLRFVKPAGSRPTAWLADIPAAESMVAAGTPFCSIYLTIGRHSVDECPLELDKRTQQMLKMLPGNVDLTLSKLLGQIREQIADLRYF